MLAWHSGDFDCGSLVFLLLLLIPTFRDIENCGFEVIEIVHMRGLFIFGLLLVQMLLGMWCRDDWQISSQAGFDFLVEVVCVVVA